MASGGRVGVEWNFSLENAYLNFTPSPSVFNIIILFCGIKPEYNYINNTIFDEFEAQLHFSVMVMLLAYKITG